MTKTTEGSTRIGSLKNNKKRKEEEDIGSLVNQLGALEMRSNPFGNAF